MPGLDGKPEKGDFLIKTLEGTMRAMQGLKNSSLLECAFNIRLLIVLEIIMKKELKSKSFTEENALCNFVNEKQISQENIQAIVQTTVYDQVYITLYYWVITE